MMLMIIIEPLVDIIPVELKI